MKALMVSAVFLSALCALHIHPALASDANGKGGCPLSVSELKDLAVAPRFFTVMAYVIEKYDKCPPCPPDALCETCQFGIYVADDNRPPKAVVSMDYGIYLRTDKAKDFQIGSRYLFTIRYRLEKSAAGAWQQTGPELSGFTLIGPDDESD